MTIPDSTMVYFGPRLLALIGPTVAAQPLLARHRTTARRSSDAHSSRFRIVVDGGLHAVIVETRWNRPSQELITMACLEDEWESFTGEPFEPTRWPRDN